MSAETSQVRCPACESTSPSAAVTSVLPSPWRALVTRTVRWLVGRKLTPKRRLERLVGLVLDRAQRLRLMAEPPADVGDLGQHRQLEQAAELPRAADPRLELRAGEHDERGDEGRGEERRRARSAAVGASTAATGGCAASASASSVPVPAALTLSCRSAVADVGALGAAGSPRRPSSSARARCSVARARASRRRSALRCLVEEGVATAFAIRAARRRCRRSRRR